MVAQTSDELFARLEQLTDDERAEAELLLEDRYGVAGLDAHIRQHFPHEPPPSHVRPIVSLLERARHERVRTCLSLPPRHAKTVTILRALGWWLKHEPADTCAYYSYSDTQARSKSRVARRWAKLGGVELLDDSSNVGEWRTRQGGGVIAGGLRSGLTGQGVSGLFVVDDPIKNREEADSALIRDRVHEAFNEVVYTRLEGASVIVVHTRWHQDDLIGRLAGDGWDVLNISALAEDDDLLGREPGEALWPSRFGADELADIRRQIGEWSFSSLYQGRPQPRGANLFREPARFRLPQTEADWREFLRGKRLIIPCDPAASERTHADYSAAGVLAFEGEGTDMRCYVLDVARGQWGVPVLIAKLRGLQARWRAVLAIEAVGGFKAVPQLLRSMDPMLRIIELRPTTDKFARSQPVAAAWNDGRVLVPAGDGVPFDVDALLGEVLSFSGVKDAHDDQVDMLAHGWNVMAAPRESRRRGHRIAAGSFG